MRLHDCPETDSLHIEFTPASSVEIREVADGMNVDFGQDGAVVGFDIDSASKRLDLSTLETEAFPFRTIRAA